MRLTSLIVSSLCLAACAAGPRIVFTSTDTVVGVSAVAGDLATADVVVLGEMHKTPPVHEAHLLLIEAMHQRRPNMVLAMEMFERDVQADLDAYLSGMIEEPTFLERTRPWPHYERDYRPVIEFAKANSLIVLAANAPAELVKKARKEGLASVAGERTVAREISAPEDDGYDAFVEMMQGHPGVTDEMMKGFYAAQCVRDDTMAETITDYLSARYAVDDRPLAVLICGQGHSDHGRGTVRRIESRLPDLDVRVVSAEAVADPTTGKYESPRDIADYVVVVPAKPATARPAAEHTAASTTAAGAPKAAEPAATGAEPTANPEGLRPALGFMPDYEADEDGVLVGTVFPDRPAARAGIEAGDVIVALGGVPTPDVDTYTEVLDAQIIGRKIKVRVRRELAEVDLEVEVGSRQR